jgi:DNA polymerase III sliding clamp (beta) subunit (PCNA family)
MKIIQEALALALRLALKVIDSRTVQPEARMVRISQGDANLELIAIANDGGLRLTMGAVADEKEQNSPMDLLVGAETLAEFVAQAPAGDNLNLVRKDKRLALSWKGTVASFPTAKPNGLHLRPASDGTAIRFDADTLRAALPQVAFAVAGPKDPRPILQGVNLQVSAEHITLAASNGFHLVTRQLPAPQAGPQPVSATPLNATLPARFCAALNLLLSTVDVDQPATLTFTDSRVVAEYGGVTLWSALVAGPYPNFAGIFPKTYAVRAVVTQAELLRLAKAVKTINPNAAALQLRPNLMALYATRAESGEAHPVGAARCGDNLTVFINPEYLIPALKVMPRGDLELRGNGTGKPIFLSPNADTCYVLMPLNAGGQTAPEPEVDLFTASGASVAVDESGQAETAIEDDDLFSLAEASRSTEKIPEGKIRKPFFWKGESYVCTGSSGATCECHQVVPADKWTGDKATYSERAKARPGSFSYAGILVKHGKTEYVLTGSTLTVCRAARPEAPKAEAPAPGQAALGTAA